MSLLLATRGILGNNGAAPSIPLPFLLPDMTPSLVCGRVSLNGLGRCWPDVGGISKSKVICSGLTRGGALDAVVDVDIVLWWGGGSAVNCALAWASCACCCCSCCSSTGGVSPRPFCVAISCCFLFLENILSHHRLSSSTSSSKHGERVEELLVRRRWWKRTRRMPVTESRVASNLDIRSDSTGVLIFGSGS